MYEIILFDLDDTLLDFAKSEHESLKKIHEAFYHAYSFFEFQEHFQRINQPLWKRVGAHSNPLQPGDIRLRRFLEINEMLGLSLDHEAVANFYEESLGESAEWLPGVKEAVDFLYNKGCLLGIVTNGLVSVQYKKHKLHALSNWFQCFVVSDKVNISKPHKGIFDIALAEISSQGKMNTIDLSKVLMVGDSLSTDGHGAKNMGIDFCLVGQKDLLKDSSREEVPIKYNIPSVSQLPRYLGYP